MLPSTKNGKRAWVTVYSYGFKGPNGYYIEKSLASIGKADPMAQLNSKLWKEGKETQVRAQGRRTEHISNVLVINDPKHPENNGKVKLWKYGPKIMKNKINVLMFPSEAAKMAGVKPVYPYDFWTGRNFILSCKKDGKYNNYDGSYFINESAPVAEDDEKIAAIWDQQFELDEFVDPANYKTYDELKARVEKVFGINFDEYVKATNTSPVNSPEVKKQEAELDQLQVGSTSSTTEEDIDFDKLLEGL